MSQSSDIPQTAASPRVLPPWLAPVVAFAVSAGALAILAALFPADTRVVAVYLLSALTASLLVCTTCPFGGCWGWRLVRAAAPAAGGFAVLVILAPAAALPAFLVLLPFAAGLGGLVELLTALRVPRRVAGGAVAILAVLLMTTLFWGTQLWRLLGRGAGDAVLHACVHANPMLALCDDAAAGFYWPTGGAKMMMYSQITRLGQDIPFVQPAWWATSLVYLVAAAVTWPLSWWIRRRGKSRASAAAAR